MVVVANQRELWNLLVDDKPLGRPLALKEAMQNAINLGLIDIK